MSKETKINPSMVKEKVEKVDETMKDVQSIDRYNTDIVKGIFLLTLAVSGNFVGETLGCQTEKAMTENVFIKHAIIIMLIYFTINFTSTDNPYPFDTAKKTAIIWAFYLMFARMSSGFTGAAIVTLVVYYILSNFTDYYTSLYQQRIDDAKSNKRKRELEQDYYLVEEQYQILREYTLYVLITIVIIGFLLYTKDKYDEYKGEFSISKYVFGTGHCKSLEN